MRRYNKLIISFIIFFISLGLLFLIENFQEDISQTGLVVLTPITYVGLVFGSISILYGIIKLSGKTESLTSKKEDDTSAIEQLMYLRNKIVMEAKLDKIKNPSEYKFQIIRYAGKIAEEIYKDIINILKRYNKFINRHPSIQNAMNSIILKKRHYETFTKGHGKGENAQRMLANDLINLMSEIDYVARLYSK